MSKTSRIVAAPGHYIIRDDESGKVSYWQGEYHQSAADSVGVSTADYIHAMHYFLMQAQAKDVLMIGCGGGTLATMLQRSGVKVTVVDLHRFSFTIARKYFQLPDSVTCHVADGIAWLRHRGATAKASRVQTWYEEIVAYHTDRILPIDVGIAVRAGVLAQSRNVPFVQS